MISTSIKHKQQGSLLIILMEHKMQFLSLLPLIIQLIYHRMPTKSRQKHNIFWHQLQGILQMIIEIIIVLVRWWKESKVFPQQPNS